MLVIPIVCDKCSVLDLGLPLPFSWLPMCPLKSLMWPSASVLNSAKFSISANWFVCGTHWPPLTKDWAGWHKESQQLVKETKALVRPEVWMSVCACESERVHACACLLLLSHTYGPPTFGNSLNAVRPCKNISPHSFSITMYHLNLRVWPELKLNSSQSEDECLVVLEYKSKSIERPHKDSSSNVCKHECACWM